MLSEIDYFFALFVVDKVSGEVYVFLSYKGGKAVNIVFQNIGVAVQQPLRTS